MLSSLLLLFFFGDMPFVNQATPYYLIRMNRREWISAQMIYVGAVTTIYLLFLLGVFCLLCAPLSFPGNMWSETGAMLGYSGVGSDIALPASVKTMEMSDPYTCVVKIFLLMLLYEILTVTWMMMWNLGKNRIGGIWSVFLLNLHGLLLNSQTLGKILHIPETVQYKSNVLCGWLSPLNHVTYYMHNFGYDYLPRIWQSCLILLVLSGVNLCVIHWLSGRYEFQFS